VDSGRSRKSNELDSIQSLPLHQDGPNRQQLSNGNKGNRLPARLAGSWPAHPEGQFTAF
jgi:hypothetical protein